MSGQEQGLRGQGNGLGRGPGPALLNAGFAHATRIGSVLERIARSLEQEPEFDVSYVVGGLNGAPAVAYINLPRTLKHVEITLEVDTSGAAGAIPAASVAILDGQLALVDAQNQHSIAKAAGQSNALCSTPEAGSPSGITSGRAAG